MSAPAPAVFLSYASQDAESARRICEALRETGVEVWFDLNELRGGDAWDQKIRRQIKECTLFVPLISANTQARPEGYFRLEWKLAVDRSHLMSDDHPFLFPVVIDDTPEALARVPDRFRAVQWTRLTLTDTPESLAARVAGLLGGATEPAPDRSAVSAAPGVSGAPVRKKKAVAGRVVVTAVILGLGGVALYAVRSWWLHPRDREPPAAVTPTPPSAGAPAPAAASRGQQLVAQARTLFEPWDFASADDFKLAERLLKEATDLEPQSADGWAALAILSYGDYAFGFDRSDARDVTLRTAAERAVKLAPDSDYARLAMALRLRRVPGTDDDAVEILQGLATRHGTDQFILRQLGSALAAKDRNAEALACFQRAAMLPGGDPIALISQTRILQRLRRIDEAEAAVTEAIRLRPDFGFAHVFKMILAFYERGDLEKTRRAVREIPARVMGDERVASVAAFMSYFARDAEAAENALRYITRDYIESNVATMPKGLIVGLVHRMAGRKEAAQIEWRQALRVLEQRLQANPTSMNDLGDKAALLALLGEPAPAEEALRVYEQLRRAPAGQASVTTWQIYADLGRSREVADFFAERLRTAAQDGPTYAALFRFHPVLDSFREQPRFKELAREAERAFTAAPARK